MHLSPKDIARFWAYVDIPQTPEGTPDLAQPWLWKGKPNRDGHGRMSVRGKHELAHRISFFLAYGYLPAVVRHLEPIPADVNPLRLLPGTQAMNVADRDRQGRTARGERNGRSKLTLASLRWARDAVARGASLREAAGALGVHHTTLHAALRGETWQHAQ